MAKELVLRLEATRDQCHLSRELRKHLKLKTLALASLQRTIAWQESRVLWLSEGDAQTRFFHAHANAWCRMRDIWSLEHEGQTLVFEQSKAAALYEFYDKILGVPVQRSCTINLDLLDMPHLDLSSLAKRFTEEEVLHVCDVPVLKKDD
jgi:hypothetical protein